MTTPFAWLDAALPIGESRCSCGHGIDMHPVSRHTGKLWCTALTSNGTYCVCDRFDGPADTRPCGACGHARFSHIVHRNGRHVTGSLTCEEPRSNGTPCACTWTPPPTTTDR